MGLDKKIRKDLISIVPNSLTPLILKSSPNNWSENEILEDLSDNDRALVLSEGRKKNWRMVNSYTKTEIILKIISQYYL